MPIATDHPRQPLGGHHFVEIDGQIIRAKTVPLLLAAVKQYRDNNARPAGNPAVELEQFYAAKFPWLVSPYNKGESTPAPEPPSNDDLIRDWVNRMWRNPPKVWVEAETARKRLAICAQCPNRTESGKSAEVNLRRLTILGAGRFDNNSLNCSSHRWSCGLAAWMENPEASNSLESCWANKPRG